MTMAVRDCKGCIHYVVQDVKHNYSQSGCGTEDKKIYGCELWECDKEDIDDSTHKMD